MPEPYTPVDAQPGALRGQNGEVRSRSPCSDAILRLVRLPIKQESLSSGQIRYGRDLSGTRSAAQLYEGARPVRTSLRCLLTRNMCRVTAGQHPGRYTSDVVS